MPLFDDVLAHLHAGDLRDEGVLRGSLVTSLWVPSRGVNDLDFLVDGAWTPATLRPVLERRFAGLVRADVSFTVIWEETDFPGLRAVVRRDVEAVQVDFGWGEQLAAAPVPTPVRGLTWRAVTPEVMFGWKVHSLVEHGLRGRWHAKTMADLYLLLRHVPLDRHLARRAVHLSFESQRMPLSALDGFLDDETWGQSRGSRNKWRSYAKKSPWVTFSLAEVLPVVREAVRTFVR
ncbi:MAG: hypothetical protein JNJ54_31500 [Myxococcaceae bacterium]|nr:hypothetical protein [Myxococcaceae bacterium]